MMCSILAITTGCQVYGAFGPDYTVVTHIMQMMAYNGKEHSSPTKTNADKGLFTALKAAKIISRIELLISRRIRLS